MISIFGDGLAGCLVCGFLFGLGVVFWCLVACLVCFPHGRDLLFLLNCVRIVCNLERPSELSWRAQHGRKKKANANGQASAISPSTEHPGYWMWRRTSTLIGKLKIDWLDLPVHDIL